MANPNGRIRSIKPSFWRDPKIHQLSDHAALLFISIWNFADDEGYFDADPAAIALGAPRFRPQAIVPILRKLIELGLVLGCERTKARLKVGSGGTRGRLEVDSGGTKVGLVVGWAHQKISKPYPSKLKAYFNQGDAESHSGNVPEPFREHSAQGKDRIGKDRIGVANATAEENFPETAPPKTKPKIQKSETALEGKSLGSRVWDAYCEAMLDRYDVAPARNAKNNKAAADIGARIGEDAIEVVKFYVHHNDAYYVKNQHPLWAMLRQVEGLQIQWKRGRAVTDADMRAFGKAQDVTSQIERIRQSGGAA